MFYVTIINISLVTYEGEVYLSIIAEIKFTFILILYG